MHSDAKVLVRWSFLNVTFSERGVGYWGMGGHINALMSLRAGVCWRGGRGVVYHRLLSSIGRLCRE